MPSDLKRLFERAARTPTRPPDIHAVREGAQRLRKRRLIAVGAACTVIIGGGGYVGTNSLPGVDKPARKIDTVASPPLRSVAPSESATAAEEPDRSRGPKGPPPVTIQYGSERSQLQPWSYCYNTGCIAGGPPEAPVHVGRPSEIAVEYPLEDWTFTAWFQRAADDCGRRQEAPLERDGDGRFILRPAGYADTYDVTLFGRGDGDLSVTFRWSTPTDGPLPEPEAYLGVVSDEGDEIVSYGVEMSITNLANDPRSVDAQITVTSREGRSVTFEPRLKRGRCRPEASLWWDGPDDWGQEATKLGSAPFEYEVSLKLDGNRYLGRGIWPTDEIRGEEPYVRLEFDPPLPRLQ